MNIPLKLLKQYFGYISFRKGQEEIISNILNKKDCLAILPTGAGKSICYQIPSLIFSNLTIVISPLISLMKDQVDKLNKKNIPAIYLNSNMTNTECNIIMKNIQLGKYKLLYIAPERLDNRNFVEIVKNTSVSLIAIDEAHCVSEWGHDFRPEYRRIRPIINELGVKPVIALTATATPKVQHDIQKNLGMTNIAVFKSSFNRPNLYYEVRTKTKNIDREIIKFIKQQSGKSGIVYCLSRKKVEELAELLTINNIKALPYHAGLDGATRSENQDAFLLEKVDVIVATIAFGMGIDKPDVRFVIHYDISKSLEGYYQETGRAGRDGGEGYCLTFYSHKDLQKMEKFMQGKPVSEQEIGRQLLIETASYAESSVCRRKTLLHYFGEIYDADNCGNCDNCLSAGKRVEARDTLLDIIETVIELKEKFKAEHIIDVMLGKTTNEIKSYRHDTVETYGCAKDHDSKFLNTVLRQAVLAGYLVKDIENYGIIHVSDKGRKFIECPTSFKIVEDKEFTEEEDNNAGIASGAACAADQELYAILLSLRKQIAAKHKLPPYVIFQEPSLEAMATNYPISIDELRNMPGVGAGKAKRFGEEFVKVIKAYVDEKEIIRPEDLRVRSVANKSKHKVTIIQAIDRKINLEEIAGSLNLSFSQLIDEIEGIVNTGTKINLAYYINEIIDEDDQSDIFEMIRGCPDDDLTEVYREYCPDYSEDEIRLMKIKFLSELGN